MKFSKNILIFALVAACLLSSFIEAKSRSTRRSHNKKSKAKASCKDTEISVTFVRENQKLPDVNGCLNKTSGELKITGASGILNKIGEKVFEPLVRGFISATVHGITMGAVKFDDVNSHLIEKSHQAVDMKKVICEQYSEYAPGTFHDSIYINSQDDKKNAMEIIADMGSGQELKKFYDGLKCAGKIKNFSKKTKRRRY